MQRHMSIIYDKDNLVAGPYVLVRVFQTQKAWNISVIDISCYRWHALRVIWCRGGSKGTRGMERQWTYSLWPQCHTEWAKQYYKNFHSARSEKSPVRNLEASFKLQSKHYTDGSCIRNGEENAQTESGVWYEKDHPDNKALRVPEQPNNGAVCSSVCCKRCPSTHALADKDWLQVCDRGPD